jgi:hypothetical protein
MTLKRTGINPGTSQLKRSGPIKPKRVDAAVPGKSSVNPVKSKRPPVTPEERAGRKGVRRRAEVDFDGVIVRLCECCGDRPGTEWSHRIGKGQLGRWDISNGLWACSQCHQWMHANPNAAKALGWMVHPEGDPLTVVVLYRGRKALLDNIGGVLFALEFKEAS